MLSKSVIECSEDEIIKLINDNFPSLNYDSIVAMEELGNQIFCTSISKCDVTSEFNNLLLTNKCKYYTNIILDQLCNLGVLEEGDYEIDCTW